MFLDATFDNHQRGMVFIKCCTHTIVGVRSVETLGWKGCWTMWGLASTIVNANDRCFSTKIQVADRAVVMLITPCLCQEAKSIPQAIHSIVLDSMNVATLDALLWCCCMFPYSWVGEMRWQNGCAGKGAGCGLCSRWWNNRWCVERWKSRHGVWVCCGWLDCLSETLVPMLIGELRWTGS